MNTRKPKLFTSVIVIILCAVIIFVFASNRSEAPVVTEKIEDSQDIQLLSDTIIVDSPRNGDDVSSGKITLSGKARGMWYFEANAPVELRDENNKLITQSYITAEGEWMTEDFVPFKGGITFTVPEGMDNGFVVFKNDNPSGEPSRDKSVSIPVKFR